MKNWFQASFAFKFNLYRYAEGAAEGSNDTQKKAAKLETQNPAKRAVGLCTLNQVDP